LNNPEGEAKRIFGKRASFYTTSACHRDPEVLNRIVELSSPEPDWLVLDVATGTGHTAFALAPHVGSLIGTDLTPEMLGEARKLRAERTISNIEFSLADTHHLSFKDGRFHLITCRRAAHHFTDILRALNELKRVLRWGGRLVIDDRSVPEDEFVDDLMNRFDRYHDPSHVRQYRPSEWVRVLSKLGFGLESVELYTKHRPLSSLTEGVTNETVRKISDIIDRLDSSQRKKLDLREVDGEWYFNHWYVMISAIKESVSEVQ
jgi:ubiquinone/menaquinone biosynthesis C-methylase UbiE